MEEQNNKKQKCIRCKVNYSIENFSLKRNGVLLKNCKRCIEKITEYRNKTKCEHGRQQACCKDCGGTSICNHGRQRNNCKECGGSSICEHNRRRAFCKECGGSSICEHNRRRNECKECQGSSVCEHNRYRTACKECIEPISLTIRLMVNGSKKSDKKFNRYDQKNFIDYCFVENLIDDCDDKCYYCNCELQYQEFTDNLATIERLDNEIGHIKGNCVIACRTCNYSKVGDRK